MMRDWLARWKNRYFTVSRRGSRPPARSFRPKVRNLEVRVVPSSYAAAPTYPAGHLPQSAVMADFNGDGKLDFAFANTPVNFFDPAISVVMGNGNGTFQAPVAYQVPSLFQNLAVDSLAVGDFNGDGKPDLAASLYGGNEIAILMNDGTGNFPVNPFTGSYQVVPVGGSPTHVLVGDFNGDGKAD
ncbi:MAG TPA: VCBS repeat-containing protein, partial [Gemmataceae bacterium]|nr:VCBS repeat-containing protein [Gemmataceae bacterium]